MVGCTHPTDPGPTSVLPGQCFRSTLPKKTDPCCQAASRTRFSPVVPGQAPHRHAVATYTSEYKNSIPRDPCHILPFFAAGQTPLGPASLFRIPFPGHDIRTGLRAVYASNASWHAYPKGAPAIFWMFSMSRRVIPAPHERVGGISTEDGSGSRDLFCLGRASSRRRPVVRRRVLPAGDTSATPPRAGTGRTSDGCGTIVRIPTIRRSLTRVLQSFAGCDIFHDLPAVPRGRCARRAGELGTTDSAIARMTLTGFASDGEGDASVHRWPGLDGPRSGSLAGVRLVRTLSRNVTR
jgi:hypothetical protein